MRNYFVDSLLIKTTSRTTTSTAIAVQIHIPPPIHPLPPIHPFIIYSLSSRCDRGRLILPVDVEGDRSNTPAPSAAQTDRSHRRAQLLVPPERSNAGIRHN